MQNENYIPTLEECKAFGKMSKGYSDYKPLSKKVKSGFASIKTYLGKDEYGKPRYQTILYKPIALCRYEYNKMLRVNPNRKSNLIFEIEYK